MKKRLLSLVLAIMISLALLPMGVFATTAASGGFSISNGVLTRYTGHDRDITIPNNVTKIAKYAFYQCTSVESVVIPESVTSIEDYAFRECSSLKTVTFPKSGAAVKNLGNIDFFRVFYHDSALEEIVNCPNESILQRAAANRACLSSWINPGSLVPEQTAGWLQRNERIVTLSNEICAGITDDYEKAKTVYHWVVRNIGYDYDYIYDKRRGTALTATDVLDRKFTICSGYSHLTQELLQAQGIPTAFMSGNILDDKGISKEDSNHTWNIAFIGGRWVIMDTTWGRPGKLDAKTGRTVDDPTGYNDIWFDPTVLYLSLSHKADDWLWTGKEDIPSDWARDGVWEAICAGLVPNKVQGAYQSDITRREFCQLMVKLVEEAAGKPVSAYLASKGLAFSDSFTDTDDAAVRSAYALGIVKGESDTAFNPNDSIQRQSAAAMLSRTAKLLDIAAGNGEIFSDTAQVSGEMKESIAFISGIADPTTGGRVMDGTGNGQFSPTAAFTREQAIITVLRLSHCVR